MKIKPGRPRKYASTSAVKTISFAADEEVVAALDRLVARAIEAAKLTGVARSGLKSEVIRRLILEADGKL